MAFRMPCAFAQDTETTLAHSPVLLRGLSATWRRFLHCVWCATYPPWHRTLLYVKVRKEILDKKNRASPAHTSLHHAMLLRSREISRVSSRSWVFLAIKLHLSHFQPFYNIKQCLDSLSTNLSFPMSWLAFDCWGKMKMKNDCDTWQFRRLPSSAP